MSTAISTLPEADAVFDIHVRAGDAALLRVISTLHQRQAHVRSLEYDGSPGTARLRLRLHSGPEEEDFLVRALQRCVDVLSVRVAVDGALDRDAVDGVAVLRPAGQAGATA